MFQRSRIILGVAVSLFLYIIYNELIPLSYQEQVESRVNKTEDITFHPCNCTKSLNITNIQKDKTNLTSNSVHSSCSAWATARGVGQKVVSFSLYGKFPGEYSDALARQLLRVETAYPGWIVRLYLDLSQQNIRQWACSIGCKSHLLDLCNINSIPGLGDISKCKGNIWRFSVIGDPLVERYLIRDLDSPILQREVDATEAWIQSGKCFHVMRDNFHHGVPMMAGMWGGCNTWNITTFQAARKDVIQRGLQGESDQPALWSYLWPRIQGSVIVHDSYTCQKFQGSLPFPTKRENYTFIGMRTFRKEFVQDRVYPKCPVNCRPKEHQDWEFC